MVENLAILGKVVSLAQLVSLSVALLATLDFFLVLSKYSIVF